MVAEKFALKKSGSRFPGVEHDSLVVVPSTGFYFWNSRGEHGVVFDFVGRHLLSLGSWNNRDPMQFMEVVRYLALRASITLEKNINFKKSPAYAERQLIQRLHDTLLNTPAALIYVTEKSGWQPTTIKAARLGFMPQDKQAADELLKRLKAHSRVFIALDNTHEANAKNSEITWQLRGETYLPQTPSGVKDANDWLAQHQVTADDAQAMLNRAEHWLSAEIGRTAYLTGLALQDAIRDVFQYAAGLDTFALATFKARMAAIGVKGRAFADLLKAAQQESSQDEASDRIATCDAQTLTYA